MSLSLRLLTLWRRLLIAAGLTLVTLALTSRIAHKPAWAAEYALPWAIEWLDFNAIALLYITPAVLVGLAALALLQLLIVRRTGRETSLQVWADLSRIWTWAAIYPLGLALALNAIYLDPLTSLRFLAVGAGWALLSHAAAGLGPRRALYTLPLPLIALAAILPHGRAALPDALLLGTAWGGSALLRRLHVSAGLRLGLLVVLCAACAILGFHLAHDRPPSADPRVVETFERPPDSSLTRQTIAQAAGLDPAQLGDVAAANDGRIYAVQFAPQERVLLLNAQGELLAAKLGPGLSELALDDLRAELFVARPLHGRIDVLNARTLDKATQIFVEHGAGAIATAPRQGRLAATGFADGRLEWIDLSDPRVRERIDLPAVPLAVQWRPEDGRLLVFTAQGSYAITPSSLRAR
ncbi:MAG: hypothetical protein P9M14_05730 [Candidatus Alcyoniella australis]|nr:hypothetical protein [Candidatus Alcyoniella australis]